MQQGDQVDPAVGHLLVLEHQDRRAAGMRAGDYVERVHTDLSSPSTPAAARAASGSSCGACPASAITVPSSAPQNARATTLAGGPGGIEPSLRPASIRGATRLTSAAETLLISRPTGWSWPLNSILRAIITRATSRRQKTAWPRASAISAATGSLSCLAGSSTSRVQFSLTHPITARARSSLPSN